MKKLLLFLFLACSSLMLDAQNRPVDSLYVWVKFSAEKIIFEIPDSYFALRSQPLKLPKHVTVRQMPLFVPMLPKHDQLISILTSELKKNSSLSTPESQLKYLSTVALLLYYSNNEKEVITEEIDSTLKRLIQQPAVTKEAGLVAKWISMIQ